MNVLSGLLRVARYLALIALVVCVAGPAPAFAQTPTSASVTRWDIFAATGGVNSTSATATQTIVAVALDPSDASIVWYTAQRPNLRLGKLETGTGTVTEWDVAGVTGVPVALAINADNGDVWFATDASPKLMVRRAGGTFESFDIPAAAFAATTVNGIHGVAVDASNGHVWASLVASTTVLGNRSGVYRLTSSTTGSGHRVAGTSLPRRLTLDNAGKVWFTNATGSRLHRLDPSALTPASVATPLWTLPATGAGGLHVVNAGPGAGAAQVCAVTEGSAATASGQAMCLNVPASFASGTPTTFTVFTRPLANPFAYPQQIAGNGQFDGHTIDELFLTEQGGDAVSFIASEGVASASSTGVTSGTVTVVNNASVAINASALTVTARGPFIALADPGSVSGSEDPNGHVRFVLPALAPLPDQPGVTRFPRPVGLTPVTGATAPGTGSMFIAESFDGPPGAGTEQMGAAISLLTVGGAMADAFHVEPTDLTVSIDVSESPLTDLPIAITKEGGGTLPWTATASAAWITLSTAVPCGTLPPSGTCGETSPLLVSIDHTGLTPGTTANESITIEGPSGVEPVVIPVAVTVTEQPTMTVAPLALDFASLTTDTTHPDAQEILISATGTVALEWTATVNLEGTELCLGGFDVNDVCLGTGSTASSGGPATVSGVGPATLYVAVANSGTAGVRTTFVNITSNATPASANQSVLVTHTVTQVEEPRLQYRSPAAPQDPPAPVVLRYVDGQPAPSVQVLLTNIDPNIPISWGFVDPFTHAVQPAWLNVGVEGCTTAFVENVGCTLAAGESTLLTLTPTNLGAAVRGENLGVLTADDQEEGNSQPAELDVTLLWLFAAPVVNLADVNQANQVAVPLTITGEANRTVNFTITGDGDPVSGAGTLSAGGTFSTTVDLSGFADGALAITAVLVNASDAVISDEGTDTSTKDATPPAAPEVSLPAGITSANVAAVPLSITGEGGTTLEYTVSSAGGGSLSDSVPMPAGGTFNVTLDLTAFGDGIVTATATLTDAAGNTSGEGSDTAAKDATPPAAPAVDLASVNAANAAAATLSITGEANATVAYTVTGGMASVSGTGTLDGSGSFTASLDLSAFPDGSLEASATLTDAAGNTGPAGSDPATKDATAPSAPVVTLPNVNAANQGAVLLTIAGEANTTVSYTVAGGSDAMTATDTMPAGGVLSVTLDLTSFDDGALTATATLTDAFGNESATGSDAAIKDTTAPAAPAVTLANVNLANVTAVTLTIAGEPNTTANYLVNGVTGNVAGTTALGASGTATLTLDLSGLADGAVTASATLTDEAGNVSAPGTATATKDTVAPAAPVITLPNVTAANQTAVPLTIAAEAGATLTYTVTDGTQSVTATVIVPPSGSYATTLDLTAFADGPITATATATDSAGNTGPSGTATATKDTTAPAAPGVDLPNVNAANATAVTLTITGEAGSTISYTITGAGAPVGGTATMPVSGTFVTIVNLAGFGDGPLTANATLTDAAGNESATGSDAAIKDTTAPAAPAVTLANVNLANVTAVPLTIAGEANTTASYTVGGVTGTVAGTTALGASGTATLTLDLSGLADGPVTASATLTDEAGNVSAPGTATATKDTVAPAAPVITLPNVTAANQTAVPLTIAAEAGATLTYTVTDGTQSVTATVIVPPSGSYATTLDLTVFADGPITATATATDPAGNTGPGGTATATKDTTAPAAPGVDLPDVNAANATAVSLTITGEAGTTVNYSVTDGALAITGVATMPDGGTLTVTLNLSSLADGPLTASATLTDGFGNASAAGTDTATKDATAPGAPAVTLPDVNGANVTAVPLTLTGEPNTTATFTITGATGAVTGTALLGTTGTVTVNVDLSGLADGPIAATATLTDAAGNTGAAGTATATKDATPPAAPGVTLPDVNAANVTAVTLTISGEAGTTVDYTVVGGAASITGTGTVAPDGLFAVALDLTAFPEGSLTATATLTDAAGNTSAAGSDLAIKDTTPPAQPVVVLADVTGANVAAVPLTITGEAGTSISYTISGTGTPVTGTGTIPPSGTFSTTVNLTGLGDGTVSASATVTDTAGNASVPGEDASSKDATPPAAPVVTLANVNAATVTAAALTITGEANAEFSYTITGVSGTPLTGAGTLPASGAFSTTVDLSGLGDGTVTASATLTDAADNTSAAGTATARKDVTAPVLTVPADMTVDATSTSGAVVTFSATATDVTSPPAVVTCTPASGTTFAVGTTDVDCTATDEAGNTATDSFTVTVRSAAAEGRMTGAGYISVPGERVSFAFHVREREPNGERGHLSLVISYAGQPHGDDNCRRNHHHHGWWNPSGADRFRSRTVTSVAFSDDPGFAPGDHPLPTMDTVVFSGVGEWNGQPGYGYEVIAKDRGEPGRNLDIFGVRIWNLANPSQVVANYAEDLLDRGNIQSHRLRGRHPRPPDTTPPVLDLPSNIVTEAAGSTGTEVSYRASARDAVSGRVDVMCTPASGSVFPLGTTTVSCLATDDAGNDAAGSFTVTVRDTTAPALTVPDDITVTATSPAGAVVTYSASATDLVSGAITPVCTPASGTTFAVGTVAVTCTATDAAANAATATFDVTVRMPAVAGARIRRGPTFNGGSLVQGSVWVMNAENVTFNGGTVTGDLLMPGTPQVVRHGHTTLGDIVDGTGPASPTWHKLTLNGGSSLGQLVRRTSAVSLPTVAAPPAPAGTRNVTLNKASDSPGSFTTIRDLTLNGHVGAVAVPAGTYGSFTANGSNRFVLGVVGATTPAVYNFRKLVLNGSSQLEIVGPVIVTLNDSMAANGSMGNASHPEWLTLRIASSGGFTLNGHVSVYGQIVAPAGQVTINGGTKLEGSVIADKLVLNSSGRLILTLPLP